MEPLERALLQAVLAEPQRDDLRLIYADYLEEHGQEQRAEFIRLQIHLTVLCQQCGCSQCVKFRGGKLHHNGRCQVRRDEKQAFDREKELLELGIVSWNGMQLPGYVRTWRWLRGFIEQVELGGDDWVSHADWLLSENPICKVRWIGQPGVTWNARYKRDGSYARKCRLRDRPPVWVKYLQYPQVARWRIALECARAYWPEIVITLVDGDSEFRLPVGISSFSPAPPQ